MNNSFNYCFSDEEIDPAETPAFHGQSFVELKKMKAHDKFSMEIEFKTLLTDGILLYAQQRKDYDPDYISLAIIAGYDIDLFLKVSSNNRNADRKLLFFLTDM